jgi:hypothetical protein
MKPKALLYGKGKSKGLLEEVDISNKVDNDKPKKSQPYKMGTTTAKASWRK